jgi:hypothetical protein
MALKYLIMPRFSTTDIAELLKAAFCAAVTIVRWSPTEPWCPPPDCSLENATVFGGLRICRAVADHLGGTLLEPPADLLVSAPLEHVKRRVTLTTLGRVRVIDRPTFVKPAAVKAFPAAVYQPGRPSAFDADADDLPVLVSEIVRWAFEVRLFVIDRQVRAATPYRCLPTYTVTPADVVAAERAGAAILDDDRVRLPSAVVLDVGLISEQGWAIVEANPLNASSFFDCDAATILPLLPRGIVPSSVRCAR